jgi:hypothetical protein
MQGAWPPCAYVRLWSARQATSMRLHSLVPLPETGDMSSDLNIIHRFNCDICFSKIMKVPLNFYVGKSISTLQVDTELKQTRILIWKILLFLNIISLYIEALVPSFHKPLKTSNIKFFGQLSEPGSDFPGPVSPGCFGWMALWSFLRMLQ